VNSPETGGNATLIIANRLELVERAADDLAHEIKNPLHSMVINLEVLRRRVSRIDEAGQADMLRNVEVLASEVERLSNRLDLLLRLLRSGRQTEPISLNDMVEELWELVRLEAARGSVQVRFQPDVAASRRYVPREPTRQIILNLVIEVLDSLSPGGALQLHSERHEDQVRLVVAGSHHNGTIAAAPPVPVAERPRMLVADLLTRKIGGQLDAVLDPEGHPIFSLSLPASL
jgi:signal transduction histidine kinase